jgi:hypothetical protein
MSDDRLREIRASRHDVMPKSAKLATPFIAHLSSFIAGF